MRNLLLSNSCIWNTKNQKTIHFWVLFRQRETSSVCIYMSYSVQYESKSHERVNIDRSFIIHHIKHRSFHSQKSHVSTLNIEHGTVKIHLVRSVIALIRFQKWIFVYCLSHIYNFVYETKNKCSLFYRAHLEPLLL